MRDFGGIGLPVVFIPSLINPPHILDLPGNSLLEWLAGQRVRPLLLDWGTPDTTDRELSVAGHVEKLLLPLLDALGAPAVLVGYCLGGTIALAAAGLRPVRGLATIAAPWCFAGFSDQARSDLAALWANARPIAEALGVLPMEVLQSAFWRLDPGRTIDKFARFAALDPASRGAQSFIPLEDWANDGAPLTIDPARLDCPLLEIVSTVDRIVPEASAAGVGRRISLAQGHVGMVVGGRARQSLWQPLAEWLTHSYLNG